MATTMHLTVSKPLELPLCSFSELHVDKISIELPRTQSSPTHVSIETTFMDRNQATGKKQWSDPETDDRSSVKWSEDNLDAYLGANPDIALQGLGAINQLMKFMAAVLTKERPDEVGDCDFEIRIDGVVFG